MLRKHESAALRLAVTLIHLAVWAQLGVVTRAFLGKFFLLGCGGGWGPCLQGSLYFKDLPSNMLGSFVIGLFAASSTVGLAVDKPLALLPKAHPWQSNFELQIGIRTGYCGSLTTFASWFLELMVPAIQDNLWVEAAAGLLVGLVAAIGSYSAGLHAALAADRWLVGEEDVLRQLERYRSSQVLRLEGLQADGGESPADRLLMQAEPDIPRVVSHPLPTALSGDDGRLEHAGSAEAGHGSNGDAKAADRLRAESHGPQQQQTRPHQEMRQSGGGGSGRSVKGAGGSAAAVPQPSLPDLPLSFCGFGASLRGYRTDAAALALLLGCTAAAAAGVGLEAAHTWLRTIWLAVLLGPAGCVLRWYLSRYNYTLGGSWDWFPAGTFAANMLGVAVDFSLQCVLQRRGGDAGYWGTLAIGAVQTGFCGCLTTVSTFVAELVKFAEAVPENYRAYRYAAMSVGGGVAAALALFGWSVWA